MSLSIAYPVESAPTPAGSLGRAPGWLGFLSSVLIFSLTATAAEPERPGVQNFRYLAPADVSDGRIVLQGLVVHRATDGHWIKLRMQSDWGVFDYLVTRIDSVAGDLPVWPGTPKPAAGVAVARNLAWGEIHSAPDSSLWLEGEITDLRSGGSEWEGRFAFADGVVRLRFKLVADHLRGSEPAPDLRNVPYGPHFRQALDVYLAKSTRPTPVAVFIHGGAWTTGDKSGINQYREFLDAGITVIAINYRYCPPENPDPATPAVAVPLRDAARAIQFIRSKAAAWNLAKDRLGVWGVSAGACTSLWLATHPDLADPASPDPVARESTRVSGAAAVMAQTSLDPQEMRAWVGPELTYGPHAFGLKGFDRFLAERARILPWIAEYSPAALLTRDSAPVFLDYLDFTLTPCEPLGAYWTHSPRFGLGFYERSQQLRHECYLRYEGREDASYASWQAFLLAKLAPR